MKPTRPLLLIVCSLFLLSLACSRGWKKRKCLGGNIGTAPFGGLGVGPALFGVCLCPRRA
jgi:hypothetical protein